MLHHILATALLAALAAASPSAVRAQELLEVERQVWTESVDRSTREPASAHALPIRLRQIYLWTQLRGSRELLDRINASSDKQVLIRHVWHFYDSDQLVVDLDMPLGIGRREDVGKLAHEVNALGYFRWRVWSHKEQLRRGHWRVDIVYDDSYEPVMCTRSGAPKPCSFAMEVR